MVFSIGLIDSLQHSKITINFEYVLKCDREFVVGFIYL